MKKILLADSLDLTSYYDLFASEKKPTGNQPSARPPRTTTASATAPAKPAAEKEPKPNIRARKVN
jgi:hypothetical protein